MRRNTVLLWLLIVFVSGTAVGVAAHRYFAADATAREDRRPPSREQVRQEYLAKMKDRVGVDDEQIGRIVAILDEARINSDAKRQALDAELKALQNHTRERIRAVLTAEQLTRYDAWREERRREREKHDSGRGGRDREKAR